MKILFLTSNLKDIGGIQEYNKNFINALKENNINFVVAELKKSILFFKIVFIFDILIKVFLFRPDIIVCSHINFSSIGYFFKKFFKKEYLITIYGIEAWEIKNSLKIKSFKEAKMIIAVSNYTKERLISQISDVREKIFILPNAVNGEKFYPHEKPQNLLSEYNLSKNDKIIITVARLSASEKYKGYDKVITSLSYVIREIPEVKYILIGDGNDIERIKNLIKELKLENRVILTGRVENLLDYYNLGDVFAMPSKGEGFGIVFLEALACGKPVIAGNQDGSVDALLGGELGILVNPDNINEIAKAIIKVLKREAPSNLLNSDYLRSMVLKSYGFDKFKEKVKNLLYVLSR
jgi:glycosyltransferase involved in cell wall biosynthesis